MTLTSKVRYDEQTCVQDVRQLNQYCCTDFGWHSATKEHAVLVNAHLDSTLPSPGAADDALSVGVMLECMRVLVGTPGWTPTHSLIFL
jgi:hypothetical protein